MNISSTQYEQMMRRFNGKKAETPKGVQARARIKDSVYDSKLERDYAAHLDLLQRSGEISMWRYHPVRLRLADGTFYTPDFLVISKDHFFELHETKGFMREAARVRLNVAAGLFPFFIFKLVKRSPGGFVISEVGETADG